LSKRTQPRSKGLGIKAEHRRHGAPILGAVPPSSVDMRQDEKEGTLSDEEAPRPSATSRTSSSGTWNQIEEDSDPETRAKHAAGIDSMIAGFDAGEAGLFREAGIRLSHFDQEQVTLKSARVAYIPQSDSKSGGCLCRSDFSPSASVPAPTRNYLPLPPAL